MFAEMEVCRKEDPIVTTVVGLGVMGRKVLNTIAEMRHFDEYLRGINIALGHSSVFQPPGKEASRFSIDVSVRTNEKDNKSDSVYDSSVAALDVILQQSDFTILLADYSDAFTVDFLKASLDKIKQATSTTVLFMSGMPDTAAYTEEAIADVVNSYFPLKDSELEDAALILSNFFSGVNDNKGLPLGKEELLEHFSSGALSCLGRGSGNTAEDAINNAINSPLLSCYDLHSASSLLVNITAGFQLSVGDFTKVGEAASEIAHSCTTIVVGTFLNPGIDAKYYVTLFLSGINDHKISGEP